VCCDGRTEDMLLKVIGLLSRSVPFAFRPKPGGSFEEVVLDVHHLLVELSDEQLYFDPVAFSEAWGDDRTYRTGFEYVRVPDAESGKPAFSLASLFTVTGRYLMKLTVIEAAGRLQCQLEYDEAGIPESEVRRVWDNLRALVESGVKSPDRRVELLDILSA